MEDRCGQSDADRFGLGAPTGAGKDHHSPQLARCGFVIERAEEPLFPIEENPFNLAPFELGAGLGTTGLDLSSACLSRDVIG